MSTPPWYLLDIWLSVELLSFVFIAISTDPRQLGGSIEKVPGPSIAPRQLVDRSSFCSCVFTLFLDNCICQRCVSRHLSRQMSRHLLTRLSVENYWRSIYWFFAIWFSFPRSLLIYPHLFTSQILSSPSKPSTHVIFSLSLLQITWYVFFFSHFFMHLDLGFGIFETFWGFSKLMSYC